MKYDTITDESDRRASFFEDQLRGAEQQHLSASLELELAQGTGRATEVEQLEQRVADAEKRIKDIRKLIASDDKS